MYKIFQNKYIKEITNLNKILIEKNIEIENLNNPTGYDRVLIEVKPSVEVMRIINNKPPEKPIKSTPTSLRNWEYAMLEFKKNKLKWLATQNYVRIHSMKFVIVTEKTLNQFS